MVNEGSTRAEGMEDASKSCSTTASGTVESVAQEMQKLGISPSCQPESKRLDYLSWEEYYMAVACLAARRSKDPHMQVGAVIVNADKRIVASGYNGMPNGCPDDQMPWGKSDENPLNTKFPFVCHAEMNAILNKNCESTKGSVIYTCFFPCAECAKLIIQSGITEVVYMRIKSNKVSTIAAKKMFDLVGVKYRQFSSSRKIVIDFVDMEREFSKMCDPDVSKEYAVRSTLNAL